MSMTEACGVCLCICERPMVYVTLASDGEFPKFTRPYGVFDGCFRAVVAVTRADRVHQRTHSSLRDPGGTFWGHLPSACFIWALSGPSHFVTFSALLSAHPCSPVGICLQSASPLPGKRLSCGHCGPQASVQCS